MAQFGAGRGGRGYALLCAKRDEERPGFSKETDVELISGMPVRSSVWAGSSGVGRGSGSLLKDLSKKKGGAAFEDITVSEDNSHPQSFVDVRKSCADDLSDIGTLSISEGASAKDDLVGPASTDSGVPPSILRRNSEKSMTRQPMSLGTASLTDSLSDTSPGQCFLQYARGVLMPGRGSLVSAASALVPGRRQTTTMPELHGSASSPLLFQPSMSNTSVDELSSCYSHAEGKQVSKCSSIPFATETEIPSDSLNGTDSKSVGIRSAVSPTENLSVATADKSLFLDRDLIFYQGSSGLEISTRVNCVHVKCRNPAIYQYHISFDPNIDNRNLRFAMVNQHRNMLGQKAFDGTILYLTKQLECKQTCLISERVTDGAKVELKITLTAILYPSSHRLIPFYNIVLHRVMKILKMCPVGRNFYDPASSRSVEKYKLNLWPGYVTSIREMEGGLYLNIDTSHKVLRNDTVLSQMQQLYHSSRFDFKDRCIKELVGSTVLTRYNNNNYRVDDIDWSMTPMSTFTTSKGETISFFQYYKMQYQIEIKDLKQPMLINRPKKATQRSSRVQMGENRIISLVPELCFLTGISDKLANDFSAMKDIGEITRLNPTDRNNHIQQFLKRVDSSMEAKQELLKWGLELNTSCASVKSRVLPLEKVMVGSNRIFQCNEEADFFREISRAPMLHAVPLEDWIIVFTERDAGKARDFAKKFDEVSRHLGMQIHPPQFIQLKDDRSDSFKHAISAAVNPNLQLVVCIFPTLRDDRYSAVKRLCCVDMPIPSQVILSKTLPRDAKLGKFRSVTMKIALQINCKLGGELWALSIPLCGLMVCGIDVYHEGKQGRGRSVAGFVASMNRLVTKWHSRAIVQQQHQELLDSLKHCFCETLTKYHEINGRLPERILLYRDGVGDGQLPAVSEHEVKQLKDAMKMFDQVQGGSYSPKFTFVVVSKRVNIRYFKESEKSMINPPPGTVLDHTVTRPNWPDFYLVSQHVRQGTVSPTHYVVVEGSCHLKPDHLQRLSYKLTHMYYNWPGTVRVPAPCQYAHKLAYLIGENVHKEPALVLCDQLFYL